MRILNILRSKGQSTVEYAILIGLVVAAAVAMQAYVKRGLQGRIFDASNKFYKETTESTDWTKINPDVKPTKLTHMQYEPTEMARQSTEITDIDTDTAKLDTGGIITRESERRTKQQKGDYQKYDYIK